MEEREKANSESHAVSSLVSQYMTVPSSATLRTAPETLKKRLLPTSCSRLELQQQRMLRSYTEIQDGAHLCFCSTQPDTSNAYTVRPLRPVYTAAFADTKLCCLVTCPESSCSYSITGIKLATSCLQDVAITIKNK